MQLNIKSEQLASIYWEETETTPKVILDAEKGLFEISGKSLIENPLSFYRPVIKWMKAYSERPNPITRVNIKLDYFSISSAKCLLDFLMKLKFLHNNGYVVMVSWLYDKDDNDMLEAGIDYSELIDLPFKFLTAHHANKELSSTPDLVA